MQAYHFIKYNDETNVEHLQKFAETGAVLCFDFEDSIYKSELKQHYRNNFKRIIENIIPLLPGVKTTGEGSGGMFVRGGNNSQNLVLLDEATVYNTNHLMGFFSTFNSDAIKDLTLYKGTAPAEYGGRISSVLDVKMNEGNNRKYHIGGGIGLISSNL